MCTVTTPASTSASAAAAPLQLPRRTPRSSKKLLWALSSSSQLIDDSTLLTASDLERPSSCGPSEAGQPRKRKACKNCSCGLAEEEDALEPGEAPELSSGASSSADSGAEDEVAFAPLAVKKEAKKQTERERLRELAEGIERGELKTSCGNCAMGDAFRCPSCPYLGLPAFTPGQKVEIDFGDDLDL